SRDSSRTDCAPESTRLQNRSSKYRGRFAKEDAKVLPEATSFLISVISFVKLGLRLPSAIRSHAWTIGTPERIIVASPRGKKAISSGLIFFARPPKSVDFLVILVTRIPCLRSCALISAALVPCNSPDTLTPLRSLPSHLNG